MLAPLPQPGGTLEVGRLRRMWEDRSRGLAGAAQPRAAARPGAAVRPPRAAAALNEPTEWATLRRVRPTTFAYRLWRGIGNDNIGLISAGVAFYAILSLFPALAAAVSIYGLAADPITLATQVAQLSSLLPSGAWDVVYEQLMKIATAPPEGLTFAAIGGILLAVWSATRAITALMTSLNIVYGAEENRNVFRRTAIALGLTVGAILFLVVAVFLVAALPAILKFLGLDAFTKVLLALMRWPLIAATLLFGLAVLYYVAPARKGRWRWISPGAVVATVLFLLGSVAFSQYVAHFQNYNETYGSVGAVIALLMWLYLTAYFTLLGAELNHELDLETKLAAKRLREQAATNP